MPLLQSTRISDATEMLVRAFDEDPYFRFAAGGEDARARLLTGIMGSFLRMAVPRGIATTVLCDEHELKGLCVWYPPGGYPPPAAEVGRVYAAAIGRDLLSRGLPLRVIRRALRMGELIDEAQPSGPHFYLQVLAVDPRWQGRGIGSELLRECVAKADRAGLPSMLETSKEMNLRLYRRFGYEIVRSTSCESSPPVWTMVRAPSPVS